MIVVTATLLFLLLFFAPMRFCADVVVFPQKLSATLRVKTLGIRVFNEAFQLRGGSLHCDGTVSTDVELKKVDKQTGIDFIQCITIDKICVTLSNNLLAVSIATMLVENVLAALATATLCNVSHCQFYTRVAATFQESSTRAQIVVTTSVAELSFCLLKQEVKLWKTRISEKSSKRQSQTSAE